jgi:hypothetical protein
MRVIVALFKYVIGAIFLLSSFALAFAIGMALSGLGAGAAAGVFGGLGITLALILFTALILMTGATAIMVSGHDRLCEIAEALRERNAMASGGRTDGR